MGPALQRLLARPSSLVFLRLLVGRPVLDATTKRCGTGRGTRRVSGLALKEDEVWGDNWAVGDVQGAREVSAVEELLTWKPFTSVKEPSNVQMQDEDCAASTRARPRARIAPPILMLHQIKPPAFWKSKSYTIERLEYESNMADPDPRRLLNQKSNALDLELWMYLLEYRKNRYGDAGVMIFWGAIFERGIRIPTRGEQANTLWYTLLDLKFKHLPLGMLEDICRYADRVFQIHNAKWPELYLQILQAFLVAGKYGDAIHWHKRLEENHAPSVRDFLRLCYEVISQQGNMPALMEIYTLNRHRKVYDKVISRLCAKEQYRVAVRWHFLLLEHGDLPTSLRAVQPLLEHLALYGPNSAARVVGSLQDAGVAFVPDIPSELMKITPKNSRDLVSDVRSKTFHVSEKQYNDSLGARWLATSWVTLDTAIKTIHALGVQEIGPISLQSIALREPDTTGIVSRIGQLKDLGISIGHSTYSLAIEHFAVTNQYEYLSLLLESDQHPSSYDDKRLQERLITHFSQTNDWKNLRLTLELLSFRTTHPATAKRNLLFRLSLNQPAPAGVHAIRENVLDMAHSNIRISPLTTRQILTSILGPRTKGHQPNSFDGVKPSSEIDDAISLLREIVLGGSRVPILFWREIIRRLGMMGHFSALERLCLHITDWYGPGGLQYRIAKIPPHIQSNNPGHPLRQLFGDSLQMAIVEWGFIHALNVRNCDLHILSGIRLLNDMAEKGVFVNKMAIRNAVLNRMVTYYGNGESSKSYNRAARERLAIPLRKMAEMVDEVLGRSEFSGGNIEHLIEEASLERMGRRRVKQDKDMVGDGNGSI